MLPNNPCIDLRAPHARRPLPKVSNPEGRPSYGITLPMGAPYLRARNPIFEITFGRIPIHLTFVMAKNDPATAALGPRGTTRSNARDFCTLDGVRELGTPLVGVEDRVWPLPACPVEVDGKHQWRAGIRLGLNAS